MYKQVMKGALFANKDKKSDKSPDYSGKGELEDGTEVTIAGWKKQSAKGTTYISLSIQEKNDRPVNSDDGFGGGPAADFEDSIPFGWRGIARI